MLDLFGTKARAERDFLLHRHAHPGPDMVGAASDAIVDVAFGLTTRCKDRPHDAGDLARCYVTVMHMPQHLRTCFVRTELERGELCLGRETVQEARKRARWPGWVW